MPFGPSYAAILDDSDDVAAEFGSAKQLRGNGTCLPHRRRRDHANGERCGSAELVAAMEALEVTNQLDELVASQRLGAREQRPLTRVEQVEELVDRPDQPV